MLSAEAKLVWMEDWTLDRKGNGCWLSHADLGVRIGMTADAVQYHRSRLAELGLYERIKRPGGRTPGWRPTLPADLPRIPSQRPSPIEVQRVRTFLDLHLRRKPATTTASQPALEPGRSRSQSVPVPVSSVLRSTAFDSQAVKQPSTALDVEGNRDSAISRNSKAIEGQGRSDLEPELLPRPIDQRPRKEVEMEGLARIRATKSKLKSESHDRATVKAEFLAVCKFENGEQLTPEQKALVESYFARQSPERRKAAGL